MYKCVGGEANQKNQFEYESKEKMSQTMARQNQQLDLISKNIEIKRKSKISIDNDLRAVDDECEIHKHITYS
jgi:hypothetical protein